MIKAIAIEGCHECYWGFDDGYCKHEDEEKLIPSSIDIPEWCPLPDIKEFCETHFNIDDNE